jgi:hypothetical protein
VVLVAAFESTAEEVALWEENGLTPGPGGGRAGPSPFRSYAPDESIASCYYDGTFVFRGPIPERLPGAPSSSPPTFEGMLFLLDASGKIVGEHGGTKSRLPLVRPTAP